MSVQPLDASSAGSSAWRVAGHKAAPYTRPHRLGGSVAPSLVAEILWRTNKFILSSSILLGINFPSTCTSHEHCIYQNDTVERNAWRLRK
eukprot:COSAG02_NODE_4295_length_5539_cov_2.488235_5_plen_90_part_00